MKSILFIYKMKVLVTGSDGMVGRNLQDLTTNL